MSREAGSASVEFVLVGLLLLVPVAYLLLAALQVQRTTFGVVEGARSAGRAYVTAPSAGVAETAARSALDVALGDQGVDADRARLRIVCSEHPCLTPSATVEVEVETDVPLPFVPAFLGRFSVRVSAVHVETVDPYRAGRA